MGFTSANQRSGLEVIHCAVASGHSLKASEKFISLNILYLPDLNIYAVVPVLYSHQICRRFRPLQGCGLSRQVINGLNARCQCIPLVAT